MRTLELLDWTAMAAVPPKVFTGSSDITALHQVIGTRLRIPTIFGAMVGSGSFVDDPDAQEHLRQMLFEPDKGLVLTSVQAEPLVPGRARGCTVGGNLSLVACGAGVPEAGVPAEGAIVLLEDIGEDPYRIDRYLTHLRRAGWFDRIGGIALGSWVECGDLAVVRDVLRDRLGGLGVPVVWELGFGHCRGQLAVPLGVEVELVSDPDSGTRHPHTGRAGRSSEGPGPRTGPPYSWHGRVDTCDCDTRLRTELRQSRRRRRGALCAT